jgi:hypothetical protein
MYLSVDPLKSCLFLIRFLVFYLIFLSLGKNIWFSYFICIIFVRGILAVLIYFTSLSRLSLKSFNLNFLVYCFLILLRGWSLIFSFNFLKLNLIFLNFYFLLVFWILIILVRFFNFLSYIIRFLKGLRKF